MTGVLIKGKDLDTDMHRERMCRREITAMHLQTKECQKKKKKRNAKTPSKPSEPRREAWNRFSLVALGRNRLCQQPWTSSLQNCETVKFLMFKPFGLWCFVMAAFSSVQSLSHVQHTATPWTAACQVTCPPLSLRVYSNSCLLSQ